MYPLPSGICRRHTFAESPQCNLFYVCGCGYDHPVKVFHDVGVDDLVNTPVSIRVLSRHFDAPPSALVMASRHCTSNGESCAHMLVCAMHSSTSVAAFSASSNPGQAAISRAF